tara:strand:+ start:30 stop:476 length:447 start_codon:yes stop_codon:yes gene_type:complete
MAARYDIEAEKGSSFIFYVKYMDDSNSAVDLVGGGYTAEMQVKRFADSTTKLLHFSSTNGGVALGLGPSGVTAGLSGGSGGIQLNATYTGGFSAGMSGSTGGIYVVADPSTMSNVPVGDHLYDLEIIQGNTIVRLVEGRFVCKSNITE